MFISITRNFKRDTYNLLYSYFQLHESALKVESWLYRQDTSDTTQYIHLFHLANVHFNNTQGAKNLNIYYVDHPVGTSDDSDKCDTIKDTMKCFEEIRKYVSDIIL